MSQPKSPAKELILEAAARLMQVRGYHRTGLGRGAPRERGGQGGPRLSKVQKDIRVMETCVAELRRHLQLYRGAVAPAVPTGDPGR